MRHDEIEVKMPMQRYEDLMRCLKDSERDSDYIYRMQNSIESIREVYEDWSKDHEPRFSDPPSAIAMYKIESIINKERG